MHKLTKLSKVTKKWPLVSVQDTLKLSISRQKVLRSLACSLTHTHSHTHSHSHTHTYIHTHTHTARAHTRTVAGAKANDSRSSSSSVHSKMILLHLLFINNKTIPNRSRYESSFFFTSWPWFSLLLPRYREFAARQVSQEARRKA